MSSNPLFKGLEYQGGAIILSGQALESLPDGPGGLEAVLRALAVRTAGPFGPQIVVNGFEDNPGLPLTHSIREIRINDNPFSAEYWKLGLGRIEVLTKPGEDKFHSEVFFNYSDGNVNSRNSFASNKAPYQSRFFGGNISGPIVKKKATFFVDFGRQSNRANAVINATTLDPILRIVPVSQAVVTPDYHYSFAPRVDIQLNPHNTLVGRYSFQNGHSLNSAVGGFSLASRAQNLKTGVHTAQLTETSILGLKTINETRLQYIRDNSSRLGNNSNPVISVPGAFTGGGADIGLAFDRQNRWELQNLTSRQSGRHFIKAGVQLKRTDWASASTQNFGGTYLFNGRPAPQLNANNEVISGAPMIPITSIEAYRRTLLFSSAGRSAEFIREAGGGASQFSITAGQPITHVRQYQVGAFLQDDWKLNTRLSLHSGLRFERQTNIPRHFDLGPRVAFALGLDPAKAPPKTVLRGGAGVFFERVGEQLVLRSLQLNGFSQQQFFTSDPAVLDLYPVVPTLSQISRFFVPQSIVRLASDIRAPYTLHSSVSLERQLPASVSVAVTYSRIRSEHLLRSRDVNSPLPFNGRPVSTVAGIFDYESSGRFNQNQVLTNLVYRANKNMTLWTTHTWSETMTDTDGPDSFPAMSYNTRADWGRSALIARHSWYFGGWIRTPWNIELTPLVVWRSGLPFDITTGRDNNGDSLFTDRPAFPLPGATGPNIIATRFGTFDLNPVPGQPFIPRNYGLGPHFLTANLRVSKTIPFNEHRRMILAVQGWNILNHTNGGPPIGSLGSSLFGVSNAAAGDWGLGSNPAGNRRLECWIFFSF
jgi:hypothetical protein